MAGNKIDLRCVIVLQIVLSHLRTCADWRSDKYMLGRDEEDSCGAKIKGKKSHAMYLCLKS
jgi:hypothetical protein